MQPIKEIISIFRSKYHRKTIGSISIVDKIPRRLWLAFLSLAKVDVRTKWSDFSSKSLYNLFQVLTSSTYSLKGKGPFGEEFVTAGGVSLKEINFKTMESKICKGLFFAGEVIDIDGLTGGFNFQHCWTSGWVAGNSFVSH